MSAGNRVKHFLEHEGELEPLAAYALNIEKNQIDEFHFREDSSDQFDGRCELLVSCNSGLGPPISITYHTLKALADLFETEDLMVKELEYNSLCDTCEFNSWEYRFSLPLPEE
jgi:hypothetical protein